MHHLMSLLARVTAMVGGLVLVILMTLMSASILGRGLNKLMYSDFFQTSLPGLAKVVLGLGVGEINGVYEMLEAGIGFAIFAFFPICQLYGAHATVDIFTSRLPARVNRALRVFWELALTATLIFISWRLFEGMQRYIGNGETTLFLQFPVWWAYAASFAASVIAGLTAIYCAIMRLGESLTGRLILPQS